MSRNHTAEYIKVSAALRWPKPNRTADSLEISEILEKLVDEYSTFVLM